MPRSGYILAKNYFPAVDADSDHGVVAKSAFWNVTAHVEIDNAMWDSVFNFEAAEDASDDVLLESVYAQLAPPDPDVK